MVSSFPWKKFLADPDLRTLSLIFVHPFNIQVEEDCNLRAVKNIFNPFLKDKFNTLVLSLLYVHGTSNSRIKINAKNETKCFQ